MPNLYACIISADAKKDREALLSAAQQFSYRIEELENGVLFDVSGLQNLIGGPSDISDKITELLAGSGISGKVAVADTTDAAVLLASEGETPGSVSADKFARIKLQNVLIENDILKVFKDLGINRIQDLRQIPQSQLIKRYGQEFKKIIELIEQKGGRPLVPNIRENSAAWDYELDLDIDDFQQLIFILNHGLDKLLARISFLGLSTEHIDIRFKLQNKIKRLYEIKTSFPTLEKSFWLKLINLRISLDPPESEIVSIGVVAYFTLPRPVQRGLYAASSPEPESLLLTINKLKKLVGEVNVGVPVLLKQRLAQAFSLDAEAVPKGKERLETHLEGSVISFCYFNPPIPSQIVVRDKRLIFIKTRHFSGPVKEYSGVWKANSRWWNKKWETREWDVEIENKGIYRLCKIDRDWFLAGEYD